MAYIAIKFKDSTIRRELSGAVRIGRAQDCEVHLMDKRLSRHHCRIEPGENGSWILIDLESTNGTYVDGERVAARGLSDGDEIEAGRAVITFHAGAMRPLRPAAPALRPSDTAMDPAKSASDTLMDTRLPMPRVAPNPAAERAESHATMPLPFQRPPASPKIAEHHPRPRGTLRSFWKKIMGSKSGND